MIWSPSLSLVLPFFPLLFPTFGVGGVLIESLHMSSDTTDGNKEIESEASGSVVRSKCYLVNCALPGGPERDTRSFMPVQNISRVSRKGLRRGICSMMNLGKTSTIFMGVLKEGIVKGVKLSKEQVICNREFQLYL